MLTGHAFNAMLKTLEEPPPHVKFILATTDPQKIPVTVLSRCLQFNLKQMTPEAIVSHLQNILTQESVSFDKEGLRLLAQAAAGSMRDALSLTDQAIAYSGGNITAEVTRDMLGTIDQRYLVRFLQQLLAGSAQGLMDVASELTTRGFSFSRALEDLASLLSRIAIEQRIPGTIGTEDVAYEDILQLAHTIQPDVLQLFYSIAIHSRAELALSPDEYTGFMMAGLRMLSLVSPQQMVMSTSAPVHEQYQANEAQNNEAQKKTLNNDDDFVPAWEESSEDEVLRSDPELEQDEVAFIPAPMTEDDVNQMIDTDPSWVPQQGNHTYSLQEMTPDRWIEVMQSFQLTGMVGELARHTEWLGVQDNIISLRLLIRISDNSSAKAKLTTLLTEYFKTVIKLHIEFGETDHTAFAVEQAEQQQRQQQAEQAVHTNPMVQALQQDFQAVIIPDSIKPYH